MSNGGEQPVAGPGLPVAARNLDPGVDSGYESAPTATTTKVDLDKYRFKPDPDADVKPDVDRVVQGDGGQAGAGGVRVDFKYFSRPSIVDTDTDSDNDHPCAKQRKHDERCRRQRKLVIVEPANA